MVQRRLSLRFLPAPAGVRALRRALALFFVALALWAGEARAAWLTLYTPRTRVHFRPGYEVAAVQAARVAERTIDQLAQRLGHEPEAPIHIALADVTDVANGFTDVLYYGRVVIFPAFPVGLGYATGLSLRMKDWLELVVAHEVVHAVHLDMAEGAARGIREVFGHVPVLSTPNVLQPAAFLEGLATFEETELVEGGRGKDPLFDMFLRTAVLESALPELDQALGWYDLGRFQPAGHVYLYGYAWYEFVARRFGADAIRELQRRYAAAGALGMPGDVVRRVLGDDLESLWRAMRRSLEERYRADIDTIRAAGETRPELVGPAARSGAWVMVSPRVSPDGRYVAYAAAGPYVEDLRLVDLEGGQDRQLALGLTVSPGGLDWSRDGRWVVYAAVDDAGGRFFSDLYRVEVATGRVERLTFGERAYAPAAGPGGWLAFARREGLATRVMVRAPSGRVHPAWEPPAGWQVLSLAWSPDGSRLAASVWKGGGSDIVLLRFDPGGGGPASGAPGAKLETAVTEDPFVDERPSWSPDGRWLLFHSDRDGVYNLYAYDVETGRLFRLTNVVTGAFDPAMSPDGKTLFFTWFGAEGYRLAWLPRARLRWEPVERPRSPGAADAPASPTEQAPVPSSWRIGPYRAGESLRPTYWIPLVGEEWPGPFLGAATAGMDALGLQAFVLEGAIGLSTGAPVLHAGYARVLGEETGPVMTVEASLAPESPDATDEGPYREQAAAAARLSFGREGYAAGWSGSAALIRTWRRFAYPDTEPWSESDRDTWVLSSAALYRTSGEHRWVAGRRWSLDVSTALELGGIPIGLASGTQVVAGWRYARRDVTGSELRLAASAGAAGSKDVALAIGGDGGPFSLRAVGEGAYRAGALALGLSVERAWRLATLKFGLGDAPTFLDDVSLAAFSEAAAGWEPMDPVRPLPQQPGLRPAPWSPAADVGAEVRLSATLDYGRLGVVLRVGLARALAPKAATRWYIAFEAR